MATALDDEEVDQGQDYRQPDVVAPPVQVAAPVAVAAPGAAPIVPPRFQPAPGYDPQATAMDDRYRAMVNSGTPIAEAEQAVATAMKYQAIRGYQRDLAAGVSASDALAKWAPTMFAGPKQSTLGHAASLVRATRPSPEKYMDVGGVAYQLQGGKATPLTPPKAIKPKTIPLVLPADPDNPMTSGHITLQLDQDDPLVKQALARARQGPVVPPPEPPGLLSRVGAGAVAGVKDLFSGGGSSPAVPTPTPAPSAQSPVTAPAAAPSPIRTAKPTTPEEKVAAARVLRKQHPDWTKKQILDAVNQ